MPARPGTARVSGLEGFPMAAPATVAEPTPENRGDERLEAERAIHQPHGGRRVGSTIIPGRRYEAVTRMDGGIDRMGGADRIRAGFPRCRIPDESFGLPAGWW